MGSVLGENEIRSAPKSIPTVLIDTPGADWTGDKREGDWGHLVSNEITIYVKHKGSKISWNKWNTSSYDHVVTLPDGNKNSMDKLLLPIIQQAVKDGKNIHIITDKNITFSRHLSIRKPEEDKWAAAVADYALENTPKDYFKMLAMHSRGAVTPGYMKNTDKLDYAIIASPLTLLHLA